MDFLDVMNEEDLLDMTIPIVVGGTSPKQWELELALLEAGFEEMTRDIQFTVKDGNKIWFVVYSKDTDEYATVKMKKAT